MGHAHRRGFLWPRLALLGALAASPAWAQQPGTSAKPQSVDKWGASLDLEGKLGTDRNLGEGDLFLPLAQDERTLLFGDIRMRFDDADSREGNFGLGLRHMLGSGWNLGAYGYFDRRRSPYGNTFSQLTFGAEALGRDWDLRANSYWPVGDTTRLVDSLNTATLSGTSVIFRDGEEKALRGFDAEVGWRVPVFKAGGPLDLRVYAGGYTFDAADVPDVTGPRLRAELVGYDLPELGDGTRVTLGAEWQHDGVRGSQGFFSLRLRIPLQSETQRSRRLSAQERRMTAPIVRDVDVVSEAGAFGAPEKATQLADGGTLTVFNSATTTGAALPGAVAGAGSNVILSGTFNTTATTTLNAGQTLMAGKVVVRSPSGRTATLTTSATIASTVSGSAAVTMANNSTLSGMTITDSSAGGSAKGVLASSVTGATISNNAISASDTGGNSGIAVFILNSTATISGNTLSGSGTGAILGAALATNGGTITVTGNTFSATDGGAPASRTLNLQGSPTINAGSSGNVLAKGSCSHIGGTTGSIGFTDGTTCP